MKKIFIFFISLFSLILINSSIQAKPTPFYCQGDIDWENENEKQLLPNHIDALVTIDLSKKNLPEIHASKFTGTLTAANYTKGATFKFENSATRSNNKKIADTAARCFNSFPESNRGNI